MAYPNDPPAPSGMTLTGESINTGLIGFWPLTDGVGVTATDLSTGGNDGTQSGGVSWASTEKGTAASFDGVDDRINASGITTDFDSSDFTVSMWINLHDSSDNQYFWVREGTSGVAYIFWITAGVLRHFNGTSSTFTRADYNVVSSLVDQWSHLTVCVSGNKLLSSSISVYKNGSLLTPSSQSNGSTTPLDGSGDFVIAGRTQDNTRNTDADIQNVRVYNRALSSTEVATLYSTPWTGTSYTDVTYAGYYLLDEPFKRL